MCNQSKGIKTVIRKLSLASSSAFLVGYFGVLFLNVSFYYLPLLESQKQPGTNKQSSFKFFLPYCPFWMKFRSSRKFVSNVTLQECEECLEIPVIAEGTFSSLDSSSIHCYNSEVSLHFHEQGGLGKDILITESSKEFKCFMLALLCF